MAPKPVDDPSSGISLGDVLIRTERHPACRQHEARSGFRMERENLAGDAKGKGASGYNREAEGTDASVRGGLPRSSDEATATAAVRKGGSSPLNWANGFARKSLLFNGRAAALARWHKPDESRGSSPDLCAARGGIPRADSANAQVLRAWLAQRDRSLSLRKS